LQELVGRSYEILQENAEWRPAWRAVSTHDVAFHVEDPKSAAIVIMGDDRPSDVRNDISAVGADESPARQPSFSLGLEEVGIHDWWCRNPSGRRFRQLPEMGWLGQRLAGGRCQEVRECHQLRTTFEACKLPGKLLWLILRAGKAVFDCRIYKWHDRGQKSASLDENHP